MEFEHYIGPEDAAKFLALNPKTVLQMARAGRLPAHPIGDGSRKRWRFLKTELHDWLRGRTAKNQGSI